MSSKRTLVVYHYFPHYREAVLRELVHNQSDMRFTPVSGDVTDVNIRLIDPALMDAARDAGGFGRIRVRNLWLGRVFLWQRGLLARLIKEDYDAVVFLGVMYHLSTWVGAALARARGKKVLFWTHGYLREEPGFQGWLRAVFYRLADRLLLYGHRAKTILANRGFWERDLIVVYNSLDVELQKGLARGLPSHAQLKAELFGHDQGVVLGFVGRLTERKRLDLLVQAAAQLRNRNLAVRLLLIGDGNARKSLTDLGHKLGVPIKFVGACHNEAALARLISAMDVCVAPGEIGLTAMHAMAYGVPVVTHDEPNRHGPEYEAIIEGRTGAFYRFGSTESLAEAIEAVLQLPRQGVALDCQQSIECCYHPRVQADLIVNAIAGLLGGVGSET